MRTDALGYRAKIGIVVPETNTIVQPECEALRPVGVTNHVARMPASKRQALTRDMDAYARSLAPSSGAMSSGIKALLPCEPTVIVIGHSINSFWGGLAGARALAEELQSLAHGTRVILPSIAIVSALRNMATGIRRVALLTPYFPPGDELVATFLESAGYEVCAVKGLCCTHPLDIASRGAEEIREGLRALMASSPDVIVQPGTNLATGGLVQEVEEELGVQLLACNTTTYWHALRTVGIVDTAQGAGRLFADH